MSDVEEVVTEGVQEQKSAFQNPELLKAFESRMNSLQGQKSSYIENLPEVVKQRIETLQDLQLEHKKIELEFHKQVVELEKKFLLQHDVVHAKRVEVITGKLDAEGISIALYS